MFSMTGWCNKKKMAGRRIFANDWVPRQPGTVTLVSTRWLVITLPREEIAKLNKAFHGIGCRNCMFQRIWLSPLNNITDWEPQRKWSGSPSLGDCILFTNSKLTRFAAWSYQ